MKDRISQYPGRIKLTPVPGQANIYDLERADSPTQAGTPLSKASLLSDATAAALGLSGDPTVDDALMAVGGGANLEIITMDCTWTAPYTGSIEVTCIGGGAGGTGGSGWRVGYNSGAHAAGGGNAGGFVKSNIQVTRGQKVQCTIGVGGRGGNGVLSTSQIGELGQSGGTTSFGTLLSAPGGSGNLSAKGTSTGGSPYAGNNGSDVSSAGSTYYAGGRGGGGTPQGGGGGGAGPASHKGDYVTYRGMPGNATGMGGNPGGLAVGGNGGGFGGGGGGGAGLTEGASGGPGGRGANGAIIIKRIA